RPLVEPGCRVAGREVYVFAGGIWVLHGDDHGLQVRKIVARMERRENPGNAARFARPSQERSPGYGLAPLGVARKTVSEYQRAIRTQRWARRTAALSRCRTNCAKSLGCRHIAAVDACSGGGFGLTIGEFFRRRLPAGLKSSRGQAVAAIAAFAGVAGAVV